MPTVIPHWRLRRLAPRAIRILLRRAIESPVIASFQETTVPKARAYMAAYDQCQKHDFVWKKEMAEGRDAVSVLLKQIQSWIPLVKRDVAGFDSSSYGDHPAVPDDVIEDGERLASVIQEYRDAKGNPLSYQKPALDALSPALQAAAKEWSEAEAADSEHQKLFASVRELADELQSDLVALRRCLMATFGRSDKDFQKLRAERADQPDEDDDANAPKPPAPIVPAAASAPLPTAPKMTTT